MNKLITVWFWSFALSTAVLIIMLCARKVQAQAEAGSGPAVWRMSYVIGTNEAMSGVPMYSVNGDYRTNTYSIYEQYSLAWTNREIEFTNSVRFLIRTEVEVERKDQPPEPKWQKIMVPAPPRALFPPPLPANRQ